MWGVTTDDITINTASQINAIKALPQRMTVRTVFDPGMSGAYYRPAVENLSKVADVMSLLIDSSALKTTSYKKVKLRIADYVNQMEEYVSIWEVGNEVNGNWCGKNVISKIRTQYDYVKSNTEAKTAITFYYEPSDDSEYSMFTWIDKNIPEDDPMRADLDYVFVSYYEDQNDNHKLTQDEIDELFSELSSRFPNSKIGFGECGWGKTTPSSFTQRSLLYKRFYNYRCPSIPSFVGGYFFWNFRQQMGSTSSKDWKVLNDILSDATASPLQ